ITQQIALLKQVTDLRTLWRSQNTIVLQQKKDYQFILDDARKIIEIKAKQRQSANNLVEEAMIAANLSAAQFVSHHAGFGIFNTHCGFDETHITQIMALLNEQQITTFSEQQLLTQEGFNQLQKQLIQLPSR